MTRERTSPGMPAKMVAIIFRKQFGAKPLCICFECVTGKLLPDYGLIEEGHGGSCAKLAVASPSTACPVPLEWLGVQTHKVDGGWARVVEWVKLGSCVGRCWDTLWRSDSVYHNVGISVPLLGRWSGVEWEWEDEPQFAHGQHAVASHNPAILAPSWSCYKLGMENFAAGSTLWASRIMCWGGVAVQSW